MGDFRLDQLIFTEVLVDGNLQLIIHTKEDALRDWTLDGK